MNEEEYTRNKSGPREEGKIEGDTGERGSYGGKLKSENTRSESMKSKYESGRKKPEGKSKLKKTGSGKTVSKETGEKVKKRTGVKPPLPEPPQIGSTIFTGKEYEENLNASEETRDLEGNTGVLIGAALLWRGKRVYAAPDKSKQHDWSSVKNGKKIADTASDTGHPRFHGSDSPPHAKSSGGGSAQGGLHSGTQNGASGNAGNGLHSGTENYVSKLSGGKYAKDLSGTRFEDIEAEPEGSNPSSRQWQKRSTQKKIMSRNNSGSSTSQGGFFETIGAKMEAAAQKTLQAIAVFFKDNPLIWILGGASCIGIIGASGAVGSMGLLLNSTNNVVITSSFTAEDEAILAVEEDYKDLEDLLKDQINDIESDNPGYDEYNYHLDPIGHDPVELAALLTVLYEAYTEDVVQEELKKILNGQYSLSAVGRTEIRTRTVTKWHWVTKEKEEERTGFKWEGGKLVSYTYTVTVSYPSLESYEAEEEYEYKIMDITLTGQSISEYAEDVLTDDQKARYDLLITTKGNKEELFQ